LPDISFVPIEPIVVSLGPKSTSQHLRFTAQLEVTKSYAEEVGLLMPRILDVLNGYLRAVEIAELENPAAMAKLRAQMLRRVQIVTGEGRVRDLLVTEFVLN
jgi:flagellar FliL protein